jgi:broad specificity phosphatase PhoE
MKRLHFIRHGESELNVQQLFAGSTDTPLTDKGRRQARQAGRRARTLGIDHIIASPLSRALETAQIIAREIGYPEERITQHDLLVERHYASLEGTPYQRDLDLSRFPDVEQHEALLERARQALEYLESLPHETILVVSHGGFGRALRHHLIKEFPYSHPHRIPNAEIFQFV